MAIFIPAGGSLMVRGGPVFWNAPIRQEHAAGDISFLSNLSFPTQFFIHPTRAGSAEADCLSIVFDRGGRVSLPLTLYFEFWDSLPFTINIRIRTFVNSILRSTSPDFSGSNAGTGPGNQRSIRWGTTITVSQMPPNATVMFRVGYSSNISGTLLLDLLYGLSLGSFSSSLLGVASVRNLAPLVTAGAAIQTSHSPTPPPETDAVARPAPPIRVVAPMPTIPSWARRVAM